LASRIKSKRRGENEWAGMEILVGLVGSYRRDCYFLFINFKISQQIISKDKLKLGDCPFCGLLARFAQKGNMAA
jgi:hypothetical protein